MPSVKTPRPESGCQRTLAAGCSCIPRAIVALALLGYGLTAGDARPVTVPFASEYQAEVWDLSDGFPENSCSGIIAAPDGYLWLGTFRGLVRFNGQTFRHWGPAAMPALATTSIISMYRDGRGRIWISTMEGLVCFDGRTWRRWQEESGWPDRADYVRTYADTPDGTIVFGQFSGRVLRFERDGFTELPPVPGTGGARCASDQDNVIYAVRNGYAGFLRNGAWQAVSDERDLAARVLGAGQDRDGHALLVRNDEVLRLRQGNVVSRIPLSRQVRPFWQLVPDARGALWLPGVEAGVFRIATDGVVTHFLKPDGLPHSAGTRVVHADASGGIWIGCGVGGLARLRPKRFRYIGETEGVGDSAVLTLAPLRDGRVLMTSYGTGPAYFDGTKAVRMPPLDDPKIASVRTVVRAADDAIWLGTRSHGLFRLAGGALAPIATEIFGPTESIHTMFEDSRHRLWVGGEQRVAVGNQGVFNEVVFAAEPQRRQPTLFAEHPDGTVLLTKHHEIFAFTTAGLEGRPLVRLPDDCRISTLIFDSRKRLWIGTTSMGLYVYSEGRPWRFPAAGGLPAATISSLVLDNNGRLWFGSGRSIVQADPDELWNVIQGRTTHPSIPIFDSDDGLHDLDLPYGTQPCAAKDAAGRLWFALIRGAAMIDPATVKLDPRPPPVVIEAISYVPQGANEPVELALTPTSPAPVLPAGSRMIRINYAALDFLAPRKQRFRVLLGGDQGRWQDMKRETTVSFLELPPGPHTIRVTASGGDGVWNRAGATLKFTLDAFYWQTGWFRALIVGGFVSLTTGGTWLIVQRRVRRARASLERERRLSEAQARLALVLENTSDFVAFATPAGQLLYLNRAGRSLVGLTPATDIAPLTTASLFPAGRLEPFIHATLPSALRTGPWSGESALRHRTGGEIPVSLVVNAHHAPDGSLSFMSMIARDISAAKRQSQIQESLRSLAAALTASLEPEQLGRAVALAAGALFRHDAFLLVLAGESDEAGTSAYMEDTPEGADGPQPMLAQGITFGANLHLVPGRTPQLLNRPSPTPAPIEAALKPWGAVERRSQSLMFAPVLWDNQVTGVISVQSYTPQRFHHADLELLQTLAAHSGAAIARIKAELSLRKNEERLRLAMQAAHMGSWEIDAGSGRLFASPEAESVYGCPPGGLSGRVENLGARAPAAEAGELHRQLQAVMAGQAETLDFAHRVVTADGAEQWLELKARRQRELNGRGHERIIGVTADITARRCAELERTKLEEQLRQSQKLEAIGTLAGGIAHDFNNILTAIIGNAELARFDAASGSPSREYLETIHRSGLRARDLVRRILAFSQPGDQRREPTALLPAVEEVVKFLRATTPASVDLRITAADSLPPVETSSTELHQVLLNLGTNAWHALHQRPGRIEFSLGTCAVSAGHPEPAPGLPPGRYVRIIVSDTGSGIAPDILPRIFDPFFTTKGPGGGSGLGLSVVHGIMRSTGGAITVQSAPGLGSKFSLYFPIATTALAPESPAAERNAALVKPGHGERILYIDDESTLVAVVERLLTRAGYVVTGCTRPHEALATFRQNPAAFDLIVTDYSMPEMSGLELAAALLQIRPEATVILTSGYCRSGLAEEARQIGICRVLNKVDAPAELLPLVAQVLSETLRQKKPSVSG